MDVADMLLDKIFHWVDLQKQCANKMEKLATELESAKKDISKIVGSSVSTGGAVAMVAAGVAALFTGGAAIPVIAVAGAVASGAGFATNVGSEIADAIISKNTMKEAENAAENIQNLEEGIQKLMTLKEEGQRREQQAGYCSDADPEDYVVERILRAMAKGNGLKINSNVSLINMLSDLKLVMKTQETDLVGQLLNKSALLLPLLSKFVIENVSTAIFNQAAKKAGKKAVAKGACGLATSIGSKATAKAIGNIGGGAVGLIFSITELVTNCENLAEKKFVSEASQSLRHTAKDIRSASESFRKELEDIREAFQKLAGVKYNIDNPQRSLSDQTTLIEFAIDNCKDETIKQWLKGNSESKAFFELIDMFNFLKKHIDEEEEEDHTNIVDITFVAHGAIKNSMIPARCLLPLPTLIDVVLYSPWNCALSADAAYGIATGRINPGHRVFRCSGRNCKIAGKKHQPTKLPDEWNKMKKAQDQEIPNIIVAPLRIPKDGAWERFEVLQNECGRPGRNRIVIPFILPGEIKVVIPFFVVTLALSVVLIFSRFRATLHLSACLGKYDRNKNLDETVLNRQYSYTIDNTAMTCSEYTLYSRLYTAFKAMFDQKTHSVCDTEAFQNKKNKKKQNRCTIS